MRKSEQTSWRKLDNAALAFPASNGKKDSRVFRFYCQLKEEVQPEILQEALDKTIACYPVFLSVLKKGLFWFYLEQTTIRPVVHMEEKIPCSHLYIRDRKTLLFEVTYYKKRINFEVFHALTDGTGATHFLQDLVQNYLCLAHPEAELPLASFLGEDVTPEDLEDDSFNKYYKDTPQDKEEKRWGYQIPGKQVDRYDLQIGEYTISSEKLLARAREMGVTITVLLTAVYLCAIACEIPIARRRKPVTLMVPVNLRKFFPSNSMLNFFGWIEVGYDFGKGEIVFENVLAYVKDFFERELTRDKIAMRMDSYVRLQKIPILRAAPLALKNVCLQMGILYRARTVTAVFSNMGVIHMLPEYDTYIDKFGVFTSTDKTELCMCSYGEKLVLGFTSRQESGNIVRNFLSALKDMGIEADKEDEEVYPQATREGRLALQMMQWFTFACLMAGITCLGINLICNPQFPWFHYVFGGIGSMWVVALIGYYKRRNVLKISLWQLAIGSAIVVLWDVLTGWYGWSVDYVLPGMVLLVHLVLVIFTWIRRLPDEEYIVYDVMAALFGLLPFLLMAAGLVHSKWLSVVCGCISLLFLSFLLVFKRKVFFMELKKRLHI